MNMSGKHSRFIDTKISLDFYYTKQSCLSFTKVQYRHFHLHRLLLFTRSCQRSCKIYSLCAPTLSLQPAKTNTKQSPIFTLCLIQSRCDLNWFSMNGSMADLIYTFNPISSAKGRRKRSPTVATVALDSRRDLAAWKEKSNVSILHP